MDIRYRDDFHRLQQQKENQQEIDRLQQAQDRLRQQERIRDRQDRSRRAQYRNSYNPDDSDGTDRFPREEEGRRGFMGSYHGERPRDPRHYDHDRPRERRNYHKEDYRPRR